MRTAGLAILGFALGAAVGIVATFTAIWLWFDVLGMTGPGTGPKPGLDWLVTLGPVLTLGGGGASAWWLVCRDRVGRSVGLFVGLGVAALVVLALTAWSVLG